MVSVMLSGCAAVATQTLPPPTITPFPSATVAPATVAPDPVEVEDSAPVPELLERYRAEIAYPLQEVFPLPGTTEYAIRIEVVVLAGDINPSIAINNADGEHLVYLDEAGVGEDEILPHFEDRTSGFTRVVAEGALTRPLTSHRTG